MCWCPLMAGPLGCSQGTVYGRSGHVHNLGNAVAICVSEYG